MNMFFDRRFLCGAVVLLGSVVLLAARALAAAPSTPPATGPEIRIVLAGDSTVTDNAGWGAGFAKHLGPGVECINLSKGGRSSGSFVAEGLWKKALDLKPDYVLVQFGHNDQPGHGPERETDPQTTYKQNMTRYVDEARAAGIKPVLVTSLSRRQWGEDGKIHSTLQPYADVVKEIAAEKNVPLIDLHARSIEMYEKLGKEAVLAMSPRKNADPKSKNSDTAAGQNQGYDGTHLNARGSDAVGAIVAEELSKAVPDLAPYIKTRTANARTINVAADGSGDFRTLKEAIAAVPDNASERTVLHLKAGTYEGQTIVPRSKTNLTFEGEGVDKTILTYGYNTNEPNPPGVERSLWGIGVVVQSDGFVAHDVTFRNVSGDHGQALALRIDGDKAVVHDCRLLGWQDTLMVNDGRQYFRNTYIEGRVDFIYGSATAVFDRCEIHSKNGGHITAANTPRDHPWGFVFLDCKLTGDAIPFDPATTNPSTTLKPRVTPVADLGRPWRPYASVTFVRCELGQHILTGGWDNWGRASNEQTARYAEYQNTGPGANPAKRVPWSRQLSKDEAEKITVQSILGGKDNWDPSAK